MTTIIRDIAIDGPFNGMNEPDPSGPYMRVVLTKGDVREERLISMGAAEVFTAEALGLLHGAEANQLVLDKTEPDLICVVPIGWRLVPEVPTSEMCTAGAEENTDSEREKHIYAAMLSSAPHSPLSMKTVRQAGNVLLIASPC